MLEFFEYRDLPSHLWELGKQFWKMADWIRRNIPSNEERNIAFRKLLEAKEHALRARLLPDDGFNNGDIHAATRRNERVDRHI